MLPVDFIDKKWAKAYKNMNLFLSFCAHLVTALPWNIDSNLNWNLGAFLQSKLQRRFFENFGRAQKRFNYRGGQGPLDT